MGSIQLSDRLEPKHVHYSMNLVHALDTTGFTELNYPLHSLADYFFTPICDVPKVKCQLNLCNMKALQRREILSCSELD